MTGCIFSAVPDARPSQYEKTVPMAANTLLTPRRPPTEAVRYRSKTLLGRGRSGRPARDLGALGAQLTTTTSREIT